MKLWSLSREKTTEMIRAKHRRPRGYLMGLISFKGRPRDKSQIAKKAISKK